MTAPSALHEQRRLLLEDLAVLSGFTVQVAVGPALYPDVTRLHMRRPSLFIADAKATETAFDAETRRRLIRYIAISRYWLEAGFTAAVALCHDPDPGRRWLECLQELASAAGVAVTRAVVDDIDVTTCLTMVSVERRPAA